MKFRAFTLRVVTVSFILATFSTAGFAQFQGDQPGKQGLSNITGAGARAMGMGGAFIAVADDATAASWNPAGLAILTRPEISLVYDSAETESDFDYAYDYQFAGCCTGRFEAISDVFKSDDQYLGFASATFPFAVGQRPLVAQVSYRNLGNFPDFDNPWTLRDSGTDASGNPYTFDGSGRWSGTDAGSIEAYGLSLAAGLTRALRVGVTVSRLDGSFGQTLDFGLGPELRTTWGFDGYQYDVGLLYQVAERVSLGAVYHAGFSADFDFRNDFLDPNDPFDFASGGDLDWPSSWGVGVAFRPLDRLTLAVDYTQTDWSSGEVSLTDGPVLSFPGFSSDGNYDTTTIRGGLEYIARAGSVLIPVRAGYFEEEQLDNYWEIFSTTRLSQPTFDGWSVGLGIVLGRVQFDAAFVHTSGDVVGSPGLVDTPPGEGSVTTVRESIDFSSDRFILSSIVRF